jgi:haloacetate dehalogenase
MKIYSRTIHANGICQHYLEAGDGPAVLLLHGFPETSYAWRFQIPELATKYRVIAPDLRGYGETDKPSSGYDKRTRNRGPTSHFREIEGCIAARGKTERRCSDT